MASYIEIYDTWQSDTLKKTITIAVLKAARDVITEDDTIPNHAARLIWARKTVADPHLMALKMSAGVILNATVQSGVYTDEVVQTVVAGLIDIFALAEV